jgi:hypothetical protein
MFYIEFPINCNRWKTIGEYYMHIQSHRIGRWFSEYAVNIFEYAFVSVVFAHYSFTYGSPVN